MNYPILIYFMFLVFFVLISYIQSAIVLNSYTVSPLTAQSANTNYRFQLLTDSDSYTIQNNQSFIIQFPNNIFSINSVLNCQCILNGVNITSLIQCSANVTNYINFSNIVTIDTNLSTFEVIFNTTGALYVSNPFISLYFMDSSGTMLSSSVTISLIITHNSMVCSLISNNSVTGSNSTYNFTIIPAVSTSSNQILQIALPTWGPFSITNFVSSALCSSTCKQSISNNTQYLTFQSIFNSTSLKSFSVLLNSIKNPFSTAPITIFLSVKTSNFFTIQNCSTTLSVNTPNTFKAINFPISNTSILAINTVALTLIFNNPIPVTTSYLKINSTLPITFNYSATTTSNIPVQTPTSDGSILLGNLSSSNLNSGSVYTIGNFMVTNPPSIKSVGITLTTEYILNKITYSIDSSTIFLTSIVSTIQTASVTILNNSLANQFGVYNINFTNINPLTNNSFVLIYFPAEIKLSINSIPTSSHGNIIIILNSNSLNLTLNKSVQASTNLNLQVTNVLNSFFTIPSSTFQIYTYYDGINSLVDQLTNGLTISASPNPIKSIILTSSSYTVKSTATYLFDINFTNSIVIDTVFIISFPVEINLTNQVKFNLNNTLNCIIQQNGQNIILSSCLIQNMSNNIQFILDFILNPKSTKPTSTFNVTTYYNNTLLQYLSSQLTINMNTTLSFNYLSITLSNYTVTAISNYTFLIVFSTIHYTGDKLLIHFPNQISISAVQCFTQYGLSSVQCSANNQILTLIMSFSTFPTNYTVSFVITGILNDWLPTSYNIILTSLTNDSLAYYIQNGTTSIAFSSGFIGVTIPSNNNIILLGVSNLSISLSPFLTSLNTYGGTFNITLTLPATHFSALNYCVTLNGICKYSSSLNGYYITSISQFMMNYLINIQSNTFYFQSKSDFLHIVLYYYLNNISYLIASNNISFVTVFCINPCASCNTIPTQCLNCLPITYTVNISYYPNNFSCLQTCPNRYYSNKSQCLACGTNCFTCLGSALNCTSCLNNLYLLNNSCINSCPVNYYQNSTEWICFICQIPCLSCLNATYCITCDSNYYYYQSSCLSKCPSSLIAINGICTICSSNCLTCYIVVNNCTSCDSQLIFYNNTCVSSCPSHYININSSCFACATVCATCSSVNVCLTCYSNQFMFNSTCISTCPAGYIQIALNCILCSSQCLTCSNIIQNCTSCASNMFKIGTTCLNECPGGLHPYNSECVVCIFPCITCQGLANNCTSCNASMYIFNHTCVSQCPQSYYIDIGTLTCSICHSQCLTCISLNNCSTCVPGSYLVSNLCYSECPKFYPIITGQTCLPCDAICLTCQISTHNCTSCFQDTYKFRYTCVKICPIGLLTNKLTNTCEEDLTSKTIFFPFLIAGGFIVILVLFSKCYQKKTSIFTCLVSLFSLPQLALYIFYSYQLTTDQEISFIIPITLSIIGIIFLIILSIIFYAINLKKIKEDSLYLAWMNTKNHYYTYLFLSWISVLNFKFYRILYSKLFNVYSLSMIVASQKSIFPHTTLFTMISSFLSSLLLIISSVYVIYEKFLKDQIFYTAVECLIFTVVSLIISMFDIYKQQTYFDGSEYMNKKRYVENLKQNRIKQSEQISVNDPPSVAIQSEKGFVTATKSFYRKKEDGAFLLQESSSNIKQINQIQAESENSSYYIKQNSQLKTQQLQEPREADLQLLSMKKTIQKINIFLPIKQQDTQIKLDAEYDSDQEIINRHKRMVKSYQKLKKKQEFFQTKSLVGKRSLNHKWYNIIKQRKAQADNLFKKQFENQINLNQQQKKQDEQELSPDLLSKKKKKIKVTKDLKQTQNIYMQRLNIVQHDKKKNTSHKKRRRVKKNDDKEKQ